MDWTPIKNGIWISFHPTHRYKKTGQNSCEFKPEKSYFLIIVFLIVGLFSLYGGINKSFWEFTTCGLVLLLTAVFLLFRKKTNALTWKGDPSVEINGKKLELSRVFGFQLIGRWDDSIMYTSESAKEQWQKFSPAYYQLNIVLKNGQRINVLEHANFNKIHADATDLTKQMKLPLFVQNDLPISELSF